MELNGAHVLITGGSRGIGAALAKEFSDAGANVTVAARSEAELKQVAADIGGQYFVVDLLDPHQVDELIPRVEAEVGPIDVLVNNAGLETDDQHANVDVERIRALSRVNFEVPMVLTRNVIRGMHARGKGHLVFLSSLASTSGFPGLATYTGTKAGIQNFVASLRLELRDTNIHTTVIAPGPVDTQMWDVLEEAGYADAMLKRFRLFQLIPIISPQKLAKRSIKAVQGNRRHVRHPRRLLMNFMMPEVPRRMTEGLLTGVKLDPPPPPE